MTNAVKPTKEAKTHFEKVSSFEKDRIKYHKTLGKIGVGFGVIGMLCGLGGVGAVIALTPLKTVEPYVIRVDNNTGFTDIVKPLDSKKEKYTEVLDKYWLSQYIIKRESYDYQLIQNSYDTVKLMSTPQIFSEYNTYITSKVSPLNLFKKSKKIKVKVLSISFVKDFAQVRFTKQVVNESGTPDLSIPVTTWQATVSFDYKHKITLEKERRINPLGFQVVGYRVDSENTTNKSN